MKTQEAIDFFGTKTKLGRALGLKSIVNTIKAWGEYPPMLRQYQLRDLSGGQLQVEAVDVGKFIRKEQRLAALRKAQTQVSA